MLGSGDSPASQGLWVGVAWSCGPGAKLWVLGLDQDTVEDGQIGTEGRHKHPHTAVSDPRAHRWPGRPLRSSPTEGRGIDPVLLPAVA